MFEFELARFMAEDGMGIDVLFVTCPRVCVLC